MFHPNERERREVITLIAHFARKLSSLASFFGSSVDSVRFVAFEGLRFASAVENRSEELRGEGRKERARYVRSTKPHENEVDKKVTEGREG